MNLPKRNSADGRCYWMKPEVQGILDTLVKERLQFLLHLWLHPVTAPVRTISFW